MTTATPNSDGGPYKVADVARMLGCSEQNVRVMVREGRLPGAFRVGPRMIRLDREQVNQWIADRLKAGGAK